MSLVEISKARNLQIATDAALWTAAGEYLGDYTEHLLIDGCSIEYNYCSRVKTTCRLNWDVALPFASHRVSLGMTVTDLSSGASARQPLGTYLMENPTVNLDFDQVWSADGYDLLTILDTPIPYSWSVADGTSIRTAVEAVLTAAETDLDFVGWYVDSTVRGDRVWPLGGQTTWIDVLDELLVSAGWRPIWLTREGYLTSDEYQNTKTLQPDFFYDATAADTTIGYGATVETDVWGIPNQWIFIADIADPAVAAPSEGNGVVRLRNESDGPSSIANRGRVINRIVQVDATDQAALQLEAERQQETDIQSVQKIRFKAVPSPQLWHRNIIQVHFPPHVIRRNAVVQRWSLPLDGNDMSIEANLI